MFIAACRYTKESQAVEEVQPESEDSADDTREGIIMTQKSKIEWAKNEILTLLYELNIRFDLIDIADNTKKRIKYHHMDMKTPKELANEGDVLIIEFLKRFGMSKRDIGRAHWNMIQERSQSRNKMDIDRNVINESKR